MQVVFHDLFHAADYSDETRDNAVEPERLAVIVTALYEEGRYELVTPVPATRTKLPWTDRCYWNCREGP